MTHNYETKKKNLYVEIHNLQENEKSFAWKKNKLGAKIHELQDFGKNLTCGCWKKYVRLKAADFQEKVFQ